MVVVGDRALPHVTPVERRSPEIFASCPVVSPYVVPSYVKADTDWCEATKRRVCSERHRLHSALFYGNARLMSSMGFDVAGHREVAAVADKMDGIK
jgi:hypothetical protein